jgi:hypothetical protein
MRWCRWTFSPRSLTSIAMRWGWLGAPGVGLRCFAQHVKESLVWCVAFILQTRKRDADLHAHTHTRTHTHTSSPPGTSIALDLRTQHTLPPRKPCSSPTGPAPGQEEEREGVEKLDAPSSKKADPTIQQTYPTQTVESRTQDLVAASAE